MKIKDSHGALDLIDEAVHLLRRAPFSILLCYFIGSGPFVLGLLYFWTDMAMSPYAARHCAEAAASITLLYLWMKCWQSVYATRLYSYAANQSDPEFTSGRIFRMMLQQTALQPYSFLILAIASLLFFPFGWIYAFYQNLSLIGNGEEQDVKKTRLKAWRLAMLWPGQNHRLIAIFFLFALVVFFNLRALLFIVPFLIRTLLGIETVFTLSGEHLLNTTFLAVVCGMTYLSVNPLIKAVYVLRCFYGESLKSGADLVGELKLFPPAKKISAAILVAVLLHLGGPAPIVSAQESSVQETVSPQQLDDAIGKIIRQREYQWRLPRDKNLDNEVTKNVAIEFLEGFYRWFRKWWNAAEEWIRSLFPDKNGKSAPNSDSDLTSQKQLWYLFAAIAVVVLAAVLWFLWKRKKTRTIAVPAEPVGVLPDVADENVLANQLPEDEWQTMARDFLLRGELRLALRALFLATLAGLSRVELISIAKFKSNLDYKKELQRRARARSELQQLFSENMSLFESSWYGMHEVNPDILNRFGANQNRIRQLAQE